MNPIVKVNCLKHFYPDKTEVHLCGLEFLVNPGERVVILGPNGAGKTTLISHILGLLKAVDGEVKVLGMDPYKNFEKVRKYIGVVFQNVDEQIIGPTVYDDIAFTMRNDKVDKNEIDKRVREIAALLKIEDILNKIPHYLSGGQKKKVALAGAIANKPKILVMDEPFNSLDVSSKSDILFLLNKINKEFGITLIITTHDLDIVPEIADKIYLISDGKIISGEGPRELFSNVGIFEDVGLEPPILSKLFHSLREEGINVKIPVNIKEAKEQLLSVINYKKV
ncbi:MAG TPA: energy-coupling factor ABC transporter ATP-binding protein [Acetivibrio saccincola]|uniref:energy-coupling factor ABC transporter ATP-binding protein n=1 Tax=Acetivibrio saccincola TaxID=1677857 RepID=UPI002C41A354|nr:energy-coupling factor ABC transporter ATP-binding protein [Acetivibrio saccincola]HOA97886.1 energy-coupling factor ABC transporter ATP-binding protein [Acetivibrio saccincola]HQD29387.1 energy-coupling factor ABC transporter ATP-binding protein [Acetivibrio saccincola]